MPSFQDQDDGPTPLWKTPLFLLGAGGVSLLVGSVVIGGILLLNKSSAPSVSNEDAYQRETEMHKLHHEKEYKNK